jgi:hypothetical protein
MSESVSGGLLSTVASLQLLWASPFHSRRLTAQTLHLLSHVQLSGQQLSSLPLSKDQLTQSCHD